MADFCGFLVILGRLWRVLWAEQGGAWLLVGLFGAVFARAASLVVFVGVYNIYNFVSGRNRLKNIFMLS